MAKVLLAVAVTTLSVATTMAFPAFAPSARAAELSSPIGGVFALPTAALEKWGWSGAWRYPVGEARDFHSAGPAGEPAYRLLRGVGGPDEGTSLHQGADIGCGRGGGAVRAAAAGLVLLAQRAQASNGYGQHVVLGHHLADGRLAYSIYAHLAESSIVVRAGQFVAAGTRIGRVGQSGRATTPHLHFEVRLASRSELRWEREQVVDPIEFVSARLPAPGGGDTSGRYFEWAQYAGLVDGADGPAAPLRRKVWWRMLAVASRQTIDALPADAGALSESLIAAGLLPEDFEEQPDAVPGWKEVARDLRRLKALGLRLPARPLPKAGHRAACVAGLGVPDPAASIGNASRLRPEAPTVGGAILAVADLAPAPDRPRTRGKAVRHHASTAGPAARDSAAGSRP